MLTQNRRIVNSSTGTLVTRAITEKIERTKFPFHRRALQISRFFYCCCGTDGISSHNQSCCTALKNKTICCMSYSLSSCITLVLTLLTCGYWGYVEYSGYIEDKETNTKVVPGVVMMSAVPAFQEE